MYDLYMISNYLISYMDLKNNKHFMFINNNIEWITNNKIISIALSTLPNKMYVLTDDQQLHLIDYMINKEEKTFPINFQYKEEIDIHVSDDDEYLAIVERHGTHGIIIKSDGDKIMDIERQDYQTKHNIYTAEFHKYDGVMHLIHPIDYDSLVITNLETKEQIKEFGSAEFIAGSSISPSKTYFYNSSWVWSPIPCHCIFKINEIFNEEKPECKVLETYDDYCWDRPFCWISDHKLAIQGVDDEIPDTLGIYDLQNGTHKKIKGPKNTSKKIFYDKYLFSTGKGFTDIWDMKTNELVFQIDKEFQLYSKETKNFISLKYNKLMRHELIDLEKRVKNVFDEYFNPLVLNTIISFV